MANDCICIHQAILCSPFSFLLSLLSTILPDCFSCHIIGDAIRHTFLDGTWDVVCSVAALNIIKAHAVSRLIYNIVAISLITEAHSGMNFPWMLCNIVPFNIFAGPVAHDIHHQTGKNNYQKFFTYLDFLFKTSSKEAATILGESDL